MIHARDLARTFKTKAGSVEAVRGLSLDVAEGELVAFLGPNGAGKSTALRMLTTLLPPSSGSASVGGHDVVSDPAAVRRQIGYVGQGTQLGPLSPGARRAGKPGQGAAHEHDGGSEARR
ncbi:ATP-binding cassette domain-containing protein [Devosia sp.]|uniref:ATP-binding cassette domain-containing protein n=1 Tax=Devosia sp. TaxID=1871048 RepID=UPI00292E338A|nr:ATP-binding cassette domain-containing protein [Devosia sp.]